MARRRLGLGSGRRGLSEPTAAADGAGGDGSATEEEAAAAQSSSLFDPNPDDGSGGEEGSSASPLPIPSGGADAPPPAGPIPAAAVGVCGSTPNAALAGCSHSETNSRVCAADSDCLAGESCFVLPLEDCPGLVDPAGAADGAAVDGDGSPPATTYHAGGPYIFYPPGEQEEGSTGHGGGGNYNNDRPHGLLGNNDSTSNDHGGAPYRYSREQQETDFKEFIAFVGWYAFLILCCLLPTFCAYYRRRRNARAITENLAGIQARLADIERRRREETEGIEGIASLGGGGGAGGDGDDRGWDYLESLFENRNGSFDDARFGDPPGADPRGGELGRSSGRRRQIVSDIMGSVSVASRMLDYMEREQRQRRERRRRLVGVLRGTSAIVTEEQLIERKRRTTVLATPPPTITAAAEVRAEVAEKTHAPEEGRADVRKGPVGVDGNRADDDVEKGLAKAAAHTVDDGDGSINGSGETEGEGAGSPRTDCASSRGGDSDVVDTVAPEATGTGSKDGEMDSPPPPSPSRPPQDDPQKDDAMADAPQKDDATAVSVALPPPQSLDSASPVEPLEDAVTSLYRVDDDPLLADDSYYYGEYDDEDDEDNKYAALRIPCPNGAVVAGGEAADGSTAAATTSTTRDVSATCAICLLQYEPGCYVSWSANKECTHAFHRDCILLWLLKKDEPYLCPCCRREFVLESMLSATGGRDGQGGGREGDDEEEDFRRTVIEMREAARNASPMGFYLGEAPPPQDAAREPPRERESYLSNMRYVPHLP